ncbi:hypothetical protein AB0L82_02405 [Nocardia sp. NPDC052001]|uniref:hypothetical protein n=1 Tax=Nocardia sp. NPDC052001 TaxID=3154853 RepID=UPI0034473504
MIGQSHDGSNLAVALVVDEILRYGRPCESLNAPHVAELSCSGAGAELVGGMSKIVVWK